MELEFVARRREELLDTTPNGYAPRSFEYRGVLQGMTAPSFTFPLAEAERQATGPFADVPPLGVNQTVSPVARSRIEPIATTT